MDAHKNARTTPYGRAVRGRRMLEEGWRAAAVASAFEVSTRSVRQRRGRPCARAPRGTRLAAGRFGRLSGPGQFGTASSA
jgi:hypothetical protein